MLQTLARLAVTAVILSPCAAIADPIKLKFAFFTSDRSMVYLSSVKPFVDAINAQAKGLIEVELFPSGALGKDQLRQAQMVLDGAADFAYVVPGMTPERFPDNGVVELPGLYRDLREATLTFTRLVAANRLKGYGDYFIVGALASAPEIIHTRPPIASLADLKGMKIRVNNLIEAGTIERLGMIPAVIPVNQVVEEISSGKIDGAAVPEAMLIEFGIGRIATYHYLAKLGSAPLVVLMNRKKFESLPEPARALIRKYSGEWAAERFIEIYGAANSKVLEQLKSEPKRKVIVPSASDLEKIKVADQAVIDEFVAKSPHNARLLQFAKEEVAKLRSSE